MTNKRKCKHGGDVICIHCGYKPDVAPVYAVPTERKCEPFNLKTKAECIHCGQEWYLMEKPPVCHAVPSQVIPEDKELVRLFKSVWRGMNDRCNNPKGTSYKRYGAKGIKVLWESFEDFERDMFDKYVEHKRTHEQTTIDRIDGTGNYCKENCRWATYSDQALNKCNTRMVPLHLVAKGVGVSIDTMKSLIKTGKTVDEVIAFYIAREAGKGYCHNCALSNKGICKYHAKNKIPTMHNPLGVKVEDTEPSGEWVREFDKEFFNVFNWIKLNCKDEIISGVDINKIDKILKARIHSLLLTQRSKLVEAAEGMKMKNTKDESNSDWFYGKGYNNALDDVLAHLKSNLK